MVRELPRRCGFGVSSRVHGLITGIVGIVSVQSVSKSTPPFTLNPSPSLYIPKDVIGTDRCGLVCVFFSFLFTLVTGPRRSLSLKLSDTQVYGVCTGAANRRDKYWGLLGFQRESDAVRRGMVTRFQGGQLPV